MNVQTLWLLAQETLPRTGLVTKALLALVLLGAAIVTAALIVAAKRR